MADTSYFHMEKATEGSREHNFREIIPDYVRQELMHLNKHYFFDEELKLIPQPQKSHAQIKDELSKIYREATGQKLQEKMNVLMEGLFLFSEYNTDDEILNCALLFSQKYNLRLLELHIHRDEGHSRMKTWTPNLHAHIVFENIERNDVLIVKKNKKGEENKINLKGKTHKFSKVELSQMQDFFASSLNLKRGKTNNREHLSHIEYKNKVIQDEINKGKEILNEVKTDFKNILSKHTKKNLLGEKLDTKSLISDLEKMFLLLKSNATTFEDLYNNEKKSKSHYYSRYQEVSSENKSLSNSINSLRKKIYELEDKNSSNSNGYERFIEELLLDKNLYLEQKKILLERINSSNSNDISLGR